MAYSIYDLLFWMLFSGLALFIGGVQYPNNVLMLFGSFVMGAVMLVKWIIYRKYGIKIVDGHVYANWEML